MAWHLHNGVEAMYQDPMGRRTPIQVLRTYNSTALVLWSQGSATRVSLRRIVAPRPAELVTHFAARSRTDAAGILPK